MARPIATADCETDPFEHGLFVKPFIWGIYGPDGYEEFNTAAEVAEYLRDKDWIVYFHNGGKFDIIFLIEYLNERENILMINGRVASAKLGRCELRDSYCILPVPLSAINKDEFDYSKMRADVRHKHMPEIRKYLYNDCFYLYEAIEKFIAEYGKKITLAATAMNQWRKMAPEKPENSGRQFYDMFEPFYMGGRVECFEAGVIEGEIEVFDISSAYPYAMTSDHATGKHFSEENYLPESREEITLSFITVECASRGQFAFKTKEGTSFPRDGIRRLFNVTGWEFLAALDTGLLRDGEYHIQRCITFKRSVCFLPYVQKFYAKKSEAEKVGDKHGRLFAKLLMNSLYGKWAAAAHRYEEYQIAHITEQEEMEAEGWEGPCQHWNDLLLYHKPLPEEKWRYYNVATAASITGFVRAMLLRAIASCERPLYCDTDSIMLIGNHGLDVREGLGGWDHEASGEWLAVAGKKLYCLKRREGTFNAKKEKRYKTATKGARLTPSQILAVARGKEWTYKNYAPSMGLKSGIKFVDRKIKSTHKKVA